jgi:hypothetical protein
VSLEPLNDSEVSPEELGGWLEAHTARCAAAVETWMLRSLPVPRALAQATWPDPSWRAPLQHAIVVPDLGEPGLLRAIDPARGVGLLTLEGDSRWVDATRLAIPHPVLVAELPEWRALIAEVGLTQGVPQLFRETFARSAAARGTDVDQFAGARFDLLSQALEVARILGFRVTGGCAVCRAWEAGVVIEARYSLGDEGGYEPTTGALTFVDAGQRLLTLAEVGPVAFSEGMRMASAIHAKRPLRTMEDDDV